ncbi:Na(+)/H(+) antiporter [Sandaracinus amylolyticus]|uniref:Na(+)/H(+) antiporter n=1 Tax=Sandaracinus amylolyticus TaxID=927083 RepID=A0A0F6YNC2_9BACT|nr:Na(+)/H(+) antiporter [Sandaracinus amylolyticus]
MLVASAALLLATYEAPARGQDVDAGRRPDAGEATATTSDAGAARERDAGATRERDAGAARTAPARARDAGPPDAGVLADAGVDDAGIPDGAIVDDAGVPDAAMELDAGTDAGAIALVPIEPAEGEVPTEIPSITGESDGSRVIRTLLGLVALLALAWIGAHPRVQRLEERMGISQVVTSGLPFVALGVICRAPGIDILNDEVLIAITPLLQFGLGWIGFHTGFQFEGAAMDEVPKGTSSVVILLTGASFATIAVACGVLLFATGLGGDPFRMTTFVRDAAIVGLAGALSAPTLERLGAQRVPARAMELARTIGVLDDVVGVVALAMLFAWLHPSEGGSWNLPGVGWLFVTFGMAATLGLVMYAVLRGTESAAESSALLIGCVCFTAGMAGFFSLPPLVVCFLAGILLKNMPGGDKPRLSAAFARLERPIYLVFLVVVGALWRVDDWRGWVLLPVFVVARIVGRALGARVARRLPHDARHPGLDEMPTPDLITPPMGALALAFVITARTLYESPATQAIVTAVIGGAVATEIIVQITSRKSRARRAGATRSGETSISSAGVRPSTPTPLPAAPPPSEPPPPHAGTDEADRSSN